MFSDTDGANAGAATAMRHSESFVEVEVADVCADKARVCKTYLSVHVGAVHEDEAAGIVNCIDEVTDTAFEYAVSRGISDHCAAEFGSIFSGFSFEVFDIDITVFIAFDGNDFHTGHSSRSWVGAVRRGRDQDSGTIALTA